MKNFLLGGIVFVLAATAAVAGERRLIEFDGRYWMPDLDSSVRVEESEIGTEFDAKDDLGIGDENFPDARVIWNMTPGSRLRLGYTQIGYDGSQTVNRSLEFKGKTYSAGTLVNSEMDISYLRLGWIWDLLNVMDDKVRVSSVVEAKGILADVTLDAPNLSPAVSEEETFAGGLPTLGLAVSFMPIDQLNLFCEASGLYAGQYGHFLDAEAGVEIKPVKYISLIGGYRMIDLKVEYEPDYFSMQIDGPFAGGKIMF